MVELDSLTNHSFYISPYNAPSKALAEALQHRGYHAKGFIDSQKNDALVHRCDILTPNDRVIIAPSKYRIDIALSLPYPEKIFFYHPCTDTLEPFKHYQAFIEANHHYDVLFLPFNNSNVIDAALVVRELQRANISCALIDINDHYYEKNSKIGLLANPDLPSVNFELLSCISFKALVCSIDWEQTIGRPLIKYCQEKGILTIGMVDGIEDFEDSDYAHGRNAYQTVEYVLVTGKNDTKHLQNKLDKVTIIGLPKIYSLWHESISFPQTPLVMLNVNFTYGTFEDARDMWIEHVVFTCKKLHLDFIISHHHADKGDMSSLPVSTDTVYDTIRKSSLVISRFSTVILEALALGKPVVYFNPHQEQVKLYKEPLGAFSIATSQEELQKAIVYELSHKHNVRERAAHFLHNQCNVLEPEKPACLAVQAIQKLLKDK